MTKRISAVSSSLLAVLFAVISIGRLDAQARSPQALARLSDSARAVGGRVIVMLKSSSKQDFLMAPGSDPVPATELQQISDRLESAGVIKVSGKAHMIGALFATVDDAHLSALNNDSNVVAIEADQITYLSSTHTSRASHVHMAAVAADASITPVARAMAAQVTPWGITRVTAPAAWALGYRGTGVKVGIMDSGGDPTHPDLGFAGGYNAVTGGTSSSDWQDDISQCGGHGTHVSGIVGARDNGVGVVGVAPEVSLYAIKVFQDISNACAAYTSTQITALQWAVANGMRVVNASIGGPWSYSYQVAVDQAAAAGTFLVAAAGNDNGGPVDFPAAFPSAIAVASLSSSNTRSSFSNIGPQLEVGAPGENIESTLPGGLYGDMSGTSMATPHVTGAVALLVQQNPSITLAQVRAELQAGALDVDAPGFDNNTGWGLLQVANSLSGGAQPLTLALSPVSQKVSVQQGAAAPSGQATVTLAGSNATTTAWTAAHKSTWLAFTTGSGTGTGTVAWSRSTTGLATGTYVDTISVTAPGATGSPAVVYDSLVITPAVVPVTMAVTPGARSVSVQQGSVAPGSSVTVTLTGTNAATTAWTATHKKSWLSFTAASDTGTGTLAWTRNTVALAVGTFVDTLTITAPGVTGSPAVVYDTVHVTAVPVTLAVSPAAFSVTVAQGGAAAGASATVTLGGTNGPTTAWSATHKSSWLAFTTSSGTGSGTMAWTRNTTSLAVGTYVDTLTVTAAGAVGSPNVIYDTVHVTAIPVTLAISPGARSVSVQQGGAAAGANVAITLSGTNGPTTAWSTTHKSSWLTLTTGSGTGSGTLAWTRNTTSLAVGTYVDTLTVTAAGAVGSPGVVYDTVHVTAVPVTLAISPGARSVSVQQGNAAAGANVAITLSGTNGPTTAWSTTHKSSWLTLTTGSGTGSGTLAWTRNTASLAVGTYVDTLTVSAAGAVGSPGVVYDTVHVTAIPVTLAVAPGARSVSVAQGSAAAGSSVTVTLTGTAGPTTTWNAAHKSSWLSLTNSGGTGSGTLAWTRNTVPLVVGTYVDTLTITAIGAIGSPATVYDTVHVTAIPVTLAVSPLAHRATVQQGNAAPSDNATVTLTGTNGPITVWTATHKQGWLAFTTGSGTGSGTLAWTRTATGLAVGTYVDTITVTAPGATGSPGTVFDTLKITAAPVPVTIAVSPAARSVSVQQAAAAPGDNVAVALAGTNAATVAWTATHRSSWLTLTGASGTGNGTVIWTRNTTALAVGTYVDTITVSATGAVNSPVVAYDTVRITPIPVPVTIAVAPLARSVSVQQGNAAPADNATVTLAGTNAGTTSWTATHRSPWLALTTASGTGSGSVAWTRNAVGLAAGTYVDTITVAATGAVNSPATLYDTLKITAAPVPVTIAVSPDSRTQTTQAGGLAVGDTVAVLLSGTNAGTASWSTTHHASWLVLGNSTGNGSGQLTWTHNASALAVGTYVDTLTISAGSAVNSPVLVFDSVRVTAAPAPLVLALSPASHGASIVRGSSAPAGSASVSLTGTGAASTSWSVSDDASWVSLVTSAGTGSGTITWQRNAVALAVGTYVDTVTVTAVGVTGSPAMLVDTLQVTAASVPLTIALGAASLTSSVAQGATSPGQVSVMVQGDGASSAGWVVTSHQPWVWLGAANGTGSGMLTWTRHATLMAVGTYVDTITVSLNGGNGSAMLFDTLHVTPAMGGIALNPRGRTLRTLQFAGSASSLVLIPMDSALVEGVALDSAATNAWVATVSSSRLLLQSTTGDVNGHVVWSRPPQSLSDGWYIDTVTVALQNDSTVQAQFVDSLNVVTVAVPTPDDAVTDLFQASTLTADQRSLLDLQGNNNGRYDLGDFLAWVSHNHIQLSASVAMKLRMVTGGAAKAASNTPAATVRTSP